MPIDNSIRNVGYGLTNALQTLSPEPVVAVRSPSTGDRAAIGTMWINTASNIYGVLTSITGGSSNWQMNNAISGDFSVTGTITSSSSKTVLLGTVSVLSGAGSPNGVVTAAAGSLFLRTDPAGATSRAYMNTDGATAWTNITCAA